jgi:hypothetical protein
MSGRIPAVISSAVEGLVDEAVAKRLISEAGGNPGPVFGKNGKPHLKQRIKGYNQAARLTPWLVLLERMIWCQEWAVADLSALVTPHG